MRTSQVEQPRGRSNGQVSYVQEELDYSPDGRGESHQGTDQGGRAETRLRVAKSAARSRGTTRTRNSEEATDAKTRQAQVRQQAMWANPDDVRHGTTNGYRNLGCHCDRCKEAQRVDLQLFRDGMPPIVRQRLTYPSDFLTDLSHPGHGTLTGYSTKGCRCVKCKAKRNTYQALMRSSQRTTGASVRDLDGDSIFRTSRVDITRRSIFGFGKQADLSDTRPSWPQMPFDRRPFDPELARIRAAGSI